MHCAKDEQISKLPSTSMYTTGLLITIYCFDISSIIFQTAYSQLIFAGKADRDPAQLAGVDNPRHYLVQNLARLSNSAPGNAGL